MVAPAVPHPVTIAPGALENLAESVRGAGPGHRVAIVTDDVVAKLYGPRVTALLAAQGASVLAIPSGEQHKTRETWAQLTDEMVAQGFGRDTTVVSLGGGVVGDIAGFVAATYMRGVPIVHVPTTLLAMVDASVGGKTGVDTPAGKNLVGAFHQPSAVVIDPLVLETLPIEHLRAGFSEILKHGIIADASYFERAADFAEDGQLSLGKGVRKELTALIARSVEIKAGIVARDEREAGLRKVLNFGHTIGHAIEAATRYATLHGQAVAIGLVAEARVAEKLGVAKTGIAGTIVRVCQAAGLPTSLPSVPVETLIEFTRTDKKARSGRVEYALPKKIGQMANADRGWTVPVEDTIVLEALSS
jgi:3-dehydroquinate synthase